MPALSASELLERALDCLPETVATLERRRRAVESYVLAAFDTTTQPWAVIAASLWARASGYGGPSPSGAASDSVDPSGDGALVAAVSVDDLRRLLEDVLEASEDRLALIVWLDRPVNPGHMRVFAVSGGDIRAGQFTCGRPRAAAPPHRLN